MKLLDGKMVDVIYNDDTFLLNAQFIAMDNGIVCVKVDNKLRYIKDFKVIEEV